MPPSGQLVLFLGSSGGTGKSRVIQAFVDFARRWHLVASHVVCASSGVAGILIGGCTLHKALSIYRDLHPPEPNAERIRAWSEIGVLFLDEFSMVKPGLFDLMDLRIRKLKTRPDRPFGGVHIIFCGDFYQLPPVGTTVYSTPGETDNAKDKDALMSMRGRELWKSDVISDVIELTENLRQKEDIKWAASLERWRINQPSQEDVDEVLARVIQPKENTLNPPPNTITAAVWNKTRENGLRYFVNRMLADAPVIPSSSTEWRHRGILLIQASIERKSGSQHVRPEDAHYVRSLDQKRLGVVGNLYCVLGATYRVSDNMDVSKGVANGTMCSLYDVCLKDEAVIRTVTLPDNTQVHAVYAKEVVCLLFQHKLATWLKSLAFPTLPPGVFPASHIESPVLCKLGTQGSFRVTVTQFPCVLSLILTGHNVQGQTMQSIIVGKVDGPHSLGKTGWIYVVFSRVQTINGLYLLFDINADATIYRPRTKVIQEMNRLRKIEKKTIARLHSVMNKNKIIV